MPSIIIAGYIVGGPVGGLVWHHLQYVIAFHRMGYKILFVEDSNDYPSCYNPITNEFGIDCTYGINFLKNIFLQYNLEDNWAYFNQHENKWYGKQAQHVISFASGADIFLNLSGVHPVGEIFSKIKCRVFIDTDPVFTQIRHLTEPQMMKQALSHTDFFSFGENFGKTGCRIPDDGISWKPTRQPVVANLWSTQVKDKIASSWTTVMHWESYKRGQINGESYGMKSDSFESYFDFPGLLTDSFEIALGGSGAPKERLRNSGWKLTDPLQVTLTHESYQQYILDSKGEWSVSKEGYVKTNSGWFSERSAAYLASSKPVVVQETGFSENIPVGSGLFSFSTPEEATEAVNEINGNYKFHCSGARDIAMHYFEAGKVIKALLENL